MQFFFWASDWSASAGAAIKTVASKAKRVRFMRQSFEKMG
jgi:uncharacterized protein with GYD domain